MEKLLIASNSTHLAPRTVENDGFVAAGSTVTSKVGESQLAVGRAKQRNIDGWKRPEKPKQ
jgi:bifunctional UDP-N-acetylglucosamine pyrophosphorylase/glucosamine-1-phosphate N-acetyltransferase